MKKVIYFFPLLLFGLITFFKTGIVPKAADPDRFKNSFASIQKKEGVSMFLDIRAKIPLKTEFIVVRDTLSHHLSELINGTAVDAKLSVLEEDIALIARIDFFSESDAIISLENIIQHSGIKIDNHSFAANTVDYAGLFSASLTRTENKSEKLEIRDGRARIRII